MPIDEDAVLGVESYQPLSGTGREGGWTVKMLLGILILVAIACLVAYLAARRETRKESPENEYRKGVDTGCMS